MDFFGLDDETTKKLTTKRRSSLSKNDGDAGPSLAAQTLIKKFSSRYRRESRIDLLIDEQNAKSEALIANSPEVAGDEEPEEVKKYATLTLPDGTIYKLEVLQSTGGPDAIDIRGLYGKTGSKYTFYDPGFTSTASCFSEITLIDGPGGQLTHRGYAIGDICQNSDFMELSYLLIYGELPSAYEKKIHESGIKNNMNVHMKFHSFFNGFLHDAHPMAIMSSVIGALASFFHENLDIHNAHDRLLCTYRLIAKMPTLAAYAYKTAIGEPLMYPQRKLSYGANFLYMMFADRSGEYEVNPIVAEAMDKFLMLHADHGQNASTSTVRIAGSSQANPYSCIAAGVSSLWGPAHGGANEAVLKMLTEIGSADRIPEFIEKAKDKKDPFRLMGFGHRVYKNYDPRARVMQDMCHRLLDELNLEDPLLNLAMELEKVACSDAYFIKRKLFPNVDFYSGIVLKAMGIPREMYTVLFALGRTVGWIAQWKEMLEDPKQRIGRPRQLYLGPTLRPYIAVEHRIESEENKIPEGMFTGTN